MAPAIRQAGNAPPRVVLDTNVCLDLFVFGDPRCAPLAAALQAGVVDAVTGAACEAEWRAVLDYPQLALTPAVRASALAAFDACVRRVPDAGLAGALGLPRCADPDDQKFLALAAAAGARWLLSRDRALLTLHRRCLRVAGFAVLAPEAWSEAWTPQPAQSWSAKPS